MYLMLDSIITYQRCRDFHSRKMFFFFLYFSIGNNKTVKNLLYFYLITVGYNLNCGQIFISKENVTCIA